MSIVKYKNQSGITYAYESIAEWDPVKKQARPKRKYLGRVDPETGEIIPTAGRRGRPKKSEAAASGQQPADTDYKTLYEETSDALKKSEAERERLEMENSALRDRNSMLEELAAAIHRQTEAFIKNI